MQFKRFETKNSDGELVGFDIDMVRELAKDLDMEIRFEEMEFTGLIPSLLNGKIDVIVSGMTATEKRAKKVTFSESYFQTKLCLLVHKDSGIEKPADANGKTIVVKQGTTGQMNVKTLFPDAKIEVLIGEADCANLVASGRAVEPPLAGCRLISLHVWTKTQTLARRLRNNTVLNAGRLMRANSNYVFN